MIIQGCIEGYTLAKRYYTLDEAQGYLTQHTNIKFNDRDFVDLAKRGELELCFYANLHFAVFDTDGVDFKHLDEYPGWYCEGYYTLSRSAIGYGEKLPCRTVDARLIDSPSKDINDVLKGRNEVELRLKKVTANGSPWIAILISGFNRVSDSELEVVSSDCQLARDDYLIQATQLYALAKKMNQPQKVEDAGKSVPQQDKPMQAKERSGLLNIIAVMLELLKSSKVGRDTDTAVISEMVENYPEKNGISKRNLEKKFADAKISLKT